MAIAANTLAQTANTLLTQYTNKAINAAAFKAAVAAQITPNMGADNASLKDIVNADAVDTLHAVISASKTANDSALVLEAKK
jgi:hypothetical protein